MVVKFGAGQSAIRLEDPELLLGEGRFTDDLSLPDQAYGVVVRSPHAHAKILEIEAEAALATAGCLLVLTAGDIIEEAGALPCVGNIAGVDDIEGVGPARYALTGDIVRYVGDAVAFVAGETREAARNAAEALYVDYEELPAAVSTASAMNQDVPQVFDEAANNVALNWAAGDAAAVDVAFEAAEMTASLELNQNRVAPSAIEPRAALASYSAEDGFTLRSPSQGVWIIKRTFAEVIKGPDAERIRVISGDVGGGFGMKLFPYGEYLLTMLAARRLKRPVKWTADRAESFQSDTHGRDVLSLVELAMDGDAQITALRIRSIANLGAYLGFFAPFVPTVSAKPIFGGVYDIPNIFVDVHCVLTNTPPVDAYRGAGRPENAYMMERIIDEGARVAGLDPAEFRRLNMIRPDQIPFTTAVGAIYDSGSFARNMDQAMQAIDWAGFDARRAEAAARGLKRGIGMAYYIECAAGMGGETVDLELTVEGRATLYLGTQRNGQGHTTSFLQMLATHLGLPADKVDVIEGDTARREAGSGTAGSKSLTLSGSAMLQMVENLLADCKARAASALQVPEDSVTFDDGLFRAEGTNKAIELLDLPATVDAERGVLKYTGGFEAVAPTFPNGCHIIELELDPDTGIVEIIDYVVVDDFGTVINPLLVEGQVQGGVAQGLGQAMVEDCLFDTESGQLLTASFMDYGLPRAADMPDIRFSMNNTFCQTNPLGSKGCGEAGTIGAMPAYVNAIVDALSGDGVTNITMPVTPEKVWRAVRG